jgi:hypothetical protein
MGEFMQTVPCRKQGPTQIYSDPDLKMLLVAIKAADKAD